jgi:hypothetical protein
MELTIDELDDARPTRFSSRHHHLKIEPIPENAPLYPPMHSHQTIPKQYAKAVRPKGVQPRAPKISYDDILAKMGMFVSDGKLNLIDRNTLPPDLSASLSTSLSSSSSSSLPPALNQPNTYIYNKYFKDEMQPVNTVRRPKTFHEYKMMVIDDYIQRHTVRQMKSTKLIMPTSNIHMSNHASPANLNKFFYVGKERRK